MLAAFAACAKRVEWQICEYFDCTNELRDPTGTNDRVVFPVSTKKKDISLMHSSFVYYCNGSISRARSSCPS